MSKLPISTEMYRKFQILYLLATCERCTTALLVEKTGVPQSTIMRQMRKLRTEFDMKIDFIRWKGLVGRNGYFQVADWGVLNEERLVAFCRLIFEENKE